RAFVIGMVSLIVLYVLANASYFWVLTPVEVASVGESARVAVVAAQQWLSPGMIALVVAALVVSTFGTVHGSILTGARVPYAMAADGLLPRRLGALSASGVPTRSVWMQGIWASVLALSGTFDTLTDYVVFGSWIFYGLTISAVFVLRRSMPEAERPYRTWGYPVVPILFLLVTGFLLVNTLITTPVQAFLGLGLIALGLPVYAYFNRRAAD
ncbi:MAG TPA: amino acid permease, partial [Rubricoccaceae bacterium]